MSDAIHVVAGALRDGSNRVLLSQRHADAHQGGLWEFPGGKVEPGERRDEALARELTEELGVVLEEARPLIRVSHRYPDLHVDLDLWQVTQWSGNPVGREGQPLRWCEVSALEQVEMPAADRPLVRSLQLPDLYAITPPNPDSDDLLQRVSSALERGVRLFQLRVPGLSRRARRSLAAAMVDLSRPFGARVMINEDWELAQQVGADGVHLKSRQLETLAQRPDALPYGDGLWVGASCHTRAELAVAQKLGADFAVLGPLRRTASHPDAVAMGSEKFATLVRLAGLPVYAIGGLAPGDRDHTFVWGAQGVAGISSFWC